MMNVNCHLHTPYSFSAFKNVDDALDRALNENVRVVGINDFYTTKGYEEWKKGCDKRRLYPLFGIELISLNQEDQISGLRINDPANPGRMYLSGKGLAYPFKLAEPYASQLTAVEEASNRQVEEMCVKLNDHLNKLNTGFKIDLNRVKNELANGLLRERHLARALRLKLIEFCNSNESGVMMLLEKIFDGKTLKSSYEDIAGVENEIRVSLFKLSGAAFVPEVQDAFLPLQSVCEIIVAAGGIPTYPFLADNEKGEYTDFEGDLKSVAENLIKRGIYSVEFISTRNDIKLLEKYAGYLHNEGFIVTFGSEHNSPAMEPIELFARNGVTLTDKLKIINYQGACIIAAHQHLVAQGLGGYINESGEAERTKRGEFVALGNELIQTAIL